jgi:hydroxymethylbilane synthase
MLRIGSRGSKLALWQAEWVGRELARLGQSARIEIIRTTGDKMTDVALAQVGAKGLFTREIEEALLAGRIDLAVHSLKDLPTALPEGLTLAAVLQREDARDAVVGRRLCDLEPGARVGTSSLRRAAQLRRLRPDLLIEPVRGNVDTRLRRLAEGRYDAIVLALAGLRRLGWEERIAEILPLETMLPAVGQGALAIETREGDEVVRAACRPLEDPDTRRAVMAERALLAGLGGGCQVPIAAHAELSDGALRLRAVVISPDGAQAVRDEIRGAPEDAEELGSELARRLLTSGAQAILEAVYGAG